MYVVTAVSGWCQSLEDIFDNDDNNGNYNGNECPNTRSIGQGPLIQC